MQWYTVRIHFPAAGLQPEETYEDAIRGTSPKDALSKAYANWPAADAITLV